VQQVIIAAMLLGLFLTATVLLTGCGGTEAQQLPGGTGVATSVATVGTNEAASTAPPQLDTTSDDADQEISEAVQSYILARTSSPIKDLSVQVLKRDDAFATAEATALMRMSESEGWQEYVATYKLKFVTGSWRVDEAGPFVSALAPQMTATAQAEEQRTVHIQDLFMLSATEGWALGHNAVRDVGTVIMHYSGGKWEQTAYFETSYLQSLYMVSPQEGWAVGTGERSTGKKDHGTIILHYKGGEWREEEHPELTTAEPALNSVYMLSAQEGWAAGNGGKGSTPLLHYKDGVWQPAKIAKRADGGNGTLDMRRIHMISPTEGWAVGSYNMMHFQNGVWTVVLDKVEGNNWEYSSPADDLLLTDVSMISAMEGWAVGKGGLLHYTDGKWSAVKPPTPDTKFRDYQGFDDVHMLSADDGWAVGYKIPEEDVNKSQGMIMHYSGGEWQEVDIPAVDGHLLTLHMVSPDEGWAAGYDGVVLHYQSGMWQLYSR
jgi:photosystem II stability/assembly factor-like uncharacterized protein